ncbi:malto-oligosyltrehalose synthase [Mucilaginibacter sp. E4BP6]|uniref:malto-oligosyltrehalose synthase n=1 Tax=Mucilaginibacter sp. E4BP6 TaxID=2723089 RepID=UPI0015CEB273|nr:malto-oligosyltrehalose synthase [Mucilaginibacter sp. E4BP6]NYE65823.1 malto-oligosyltrehalose synthase/4-alpha-glucanotransferase [Mucilaginibacter sp. E4BP6]
MYNPVSTYRIQFHKGFTFADFEQVIPYLEKLGVNTIYASPIFTSVPGSMHGYDGVDPLSINPEIGTIEQLRVIAEKLKAKKIGWIQDIVPNHMAYHYTNRWLMNVLEKGDSSDYKSFFDDSLTDELLFKGPIMVPFLGSSLEKVIENDELTIEKIDDKLWFKYADQRWPLKPESYLNITHSEKTSKDQLLQIANEQHYRLCSYQETDRIINFRRFFTVNSLLCLNIQNNEVFNQFHQLIIQLVKEDIFQGIRIDHIDGLYDPSKYLNQLREVVGNDVYIVVEKILEEGEQMPIWPIEGNTGYDFLALVNNLLTGAANKDKFSSFYKTLIPVTNPVSDQVHDKKAYILKNQMAGELDNLTNLFLKLDLGKHKEIKNEDIKQAIAQFLINCPEYRFYGNNFPLNKEEEKQVKKILNSVKKSNKKLSTAVELLSAAFFNSKHNLEALHFYMRCMQFTGPLMAKGVEDTLMYTYNRFIGHNEVGDAPDAFSISPVQFHAAMKTRQDKWPLSLNATSTHDTKRGEDVRARLNVLPDMATEWLETIRNWQALNRDIKQIGAPDANDEYFIYQTLIGAYPMPGENEDNFKDRLQEYLQKTMREAKLHSNWSAPNAEYENAVKDFAIKLLDKRRPFWKSFTGIHQKISHQGIINSLTQVILKFTCPGTPDIYQGCEHWDLSLVDPDNRRPVDYKGREGLLTDNPSLKNLWDNKFNGHIKIWLVQLLLHERKANPLLFAEGDYLPLKITGKYAANLFAFARSYKRTWYITVVTLNLAGTPITDWEDSAIIMPENAPENFSNLITKTTGKQTHGIKIGTIFTTVPFALLKLDHPDSGRGSGILMHITSLSSKFGIGDLGPEAKAFADILHCSNQKYWQLLPLSPINEQNKYSPYSSYSSMAGNTLLLSPELLARDYLFNVHEFVLHQTDKVDYGKVTITKQLIFDKAWINFKALNNEIQQHEFIKFCKKEALWLEDYTVYVALKQKFNYKPWYKWPEEFKFREEKALTNFVINNSDIIQKEKWLQYQFNRQWSSLKSYCQKLDVKLFGDLPFYVSYDSADVWAHPELFSLDTEGKMSKVAGVPPDYFATDGQLWGMPVFCWEKLKEQNYDWWVQRIRKNLEQFDLLRLDHFRAFSNYWAIPADSKSAVNGEWESGPGADLFHVLKKEFGNLPFVAEDLGDIDDAVYNLRDEFDLPGMRVLQFAFGGEAYLLSPHLPQNYTVNTVAYTGTHDNNTTKGWYRKDANQKALKQVKNYTGRTAKERNINNIFIRTVLASIAKIAIIPMQDILDLDESSRMNVPANTTDNWSWRYQSFAMKNKTIKHIAELAKIYNRW